MLTEAEQTVFETIQKQLAPIDDELQKMEQRRKELLKAKERLEAAKASFKVSGKSKNSADEKTVLEVCKTIVEENMPIMRADLEGLAKDKLKEMGFSLTGLHRRLEKCLADPVFHLDANEAVTLKQA